MGALGSSLAVALCVLPDLALAQALPARQPLGEIHINLDILAFEAEDILSVDRFELDGLSGVQIELSPRLGPWLADKTRDKVGFELNLLICGKWVIRSRIQEVITSATFALTSGDAAEMDDVAEAFRRPPCSDL